MASTSTGLAPRARRHLPPLTLALAVCLGQALAYCVLGLFAPGHILLLEHFQVGDDYHYFLQAAQHWLDGGSPYRAQGFVTPPPSLLPALLLRYLPDPTATDVFGIVTALLVALALWRYAAVLGVVRRHRAGLLAVAFSFLPMWMLLNGSNNDGLMLALMIFAVTARSRGARALSLAGSMVLKVYSGLLLVILARRRQFALVALTLVLCLLALLPFWRWLPDMLAALFHRSGTFGPGAYNNISPAGLLMLTVGRFGPLAWKVPYFLFWFATLAYVLARDRSQGAATLGVYAPWMIAAPGFVWAYAAVVALPAFVLRVATAEKRPLRAWEWIGVAGFLLLDLHPEFVALVMGWGWEARRGLDLVTSVAGSLGTTLLIVSSVGVARASALRDSRPG